MKSKLAELQPNKEFQAFMEKISKSANYFAAKNASSDDRFYAMDLCLAYAFEAGMKSVSTTVQGGKDD